MLNLSSLIHQKIIMFVESILICIVCEAKVAIYIYKDHPNQYKNSHKLYDEMAHPVLSLMESQWKLRQHDQRFPIEGYTL